MRFHVVGLPHTEVTKEYTWCAYTQKVLNFCRMMKERGHHVTLYNGGEKTTAPCDEFISLVSYEEQALLPKIWELSFDNTTPYWKSFNERAVAAIRPRFQQGDFLCVIMGASHYPIAQELKEHPVEFGIGYTGTIGGSFKVFESQTWRGFCYGYKQNMLGSSLDTVINNYYDSEEFEVGEPADYYFYIGRLIENKGVPEAVKACENSAQRLILAGEGPCNPASPIATYVGHANVEQRKTFMKHAQGQFVLTRYFEPFGGAHAEALLSGCPVITSDFGVFPETVINGFNGFRCNTMQEIQIAMHKVGQLDRKAIREHAKARFDLSVIGPQYEEYFERLLDARRTTSKFPKS